MFFDSRLELDGCDSLRLNAIVAYPLGIHLILEEVIGLRRHVNADSMKPEIATTLAHETFFTVALDFSMADSTRMNGRRIRVLRVKDHGLIGWIDLSPHSRGAHHRTTWHSRATHSWRSMRWRSMRVHRWVAVWGHHAMWMIRWEHVWSRTAHHVGRHHVAWAHGRSVHARSVWPALHVWGHHAWLVLARWWSVLAGGTLHAVWTVGTRRSRWSTLHLVMR